MTLAKNVPSADHVSKTQTKLIVLFANVDNKPSKMTPTFIEYQPLSSKVSPKFMKYQPVMVPTTMLVQYFNVTAVMKCMALQ